METETSQLWKLYYVKRKALLTSFIKVIMTDYYTTQFICCWVPFRVTVLHTHTLGCIYCNKKCHSQIGKKIRLWRIKESGNWKWQEPMASHTCRVENMFIRQAGENKKNCIYVSYHVSFTDCALLHNNHSGWTEKVDVVHISKRKKQKNQNYRSFKRKQIVLILFWIYEITPHSFNMYMSYLRSSSTSQHNSSVLHKNFVTLN